LHIHALPSQKNKTGGQYENDAVVFIDIISQCHIPKFVYTTNEKIFQCLSPGSGKIMIKFLFTYRALAFILIFYLSSFVRTGIPDG